MEILFWVGSRPTERRHDVGNVWLFVIASISGRRRKSLASMDSFAVIEVSFGCGSS